MIEVDSVARSQFKEECFGKVPFQNFFVAHGLDKGDVLGLMDQGLFFLFLKRDEVFPMNDPKAILSPVG